ncbi:MAG: class I SAM-dependent methyltransferase [Anaerolineae bacterium]|nr:class I SAM-dependent methyltransferase [Anaerolineae bacterium]
MTQETTRYDTTRAAWEDIWEQASVEAELKSVRYPRSMATIEAYLPYLSKDRLILEAGSGLSAVVITLREMGYPVVGMDYALNALQISRRYDPSLALFGGDVHRLPCADNSVGAYLSFGVLEHFEHGMEPALREAFRVIAPGGTLVLTIPYPNVVHQLIAWWRRRQGTSVLNDDEFYESTYTRAALVAAAENVGFRLEKAIPTSHAYTLWGLGGPFRGEGYYETSPLAMRLGAVLEKVLPWPFNFSTLLIARKP